MPQPLLPVLRESRRYVVFEVIADKKFYEKNIADAIYSSAFQLFGEIGLSKVGLKIILIEGNKGIIRVGRGAVEEVRVCLGFIKAVSKTEAVFNVVSVTGTIKKAKAAMSVKEQG